jgi:hypothetical protein
LPPKRWKSTTPSWSCCTSRYAAIVPLGCRGGADAGAGVLVLVPVLVLALVLVLVLVLVL